MKDIKFILGILGGTLILALGVSLFFANPPASGPAESIDSQKLVLGAANSRGSENAPVTIVEFSDFQCPACRNAWGLMESMALEYGNKTRLIYRHFPITAIHDQAISAAMAAEAAAAQGKFWEYAAILFDQQDAWSQIKNPRDLFLSYAGQAGVLDFDKFRQDLENDANKDKVLEDLRLGSRSGVGAVPAFFVNGEKTDLNGLKLAVEKIISQPR